MTYFVLSPATVKLYRIRATLCAALLFFSGVFLPLGVLIAYLTVIIWAFFVFYYIPKFIKSFRISIGRKGITVKYGVFIKVSKICPDSCNIFAKYGETPLSHILGLKSVSFYAAREKIRIPETEYAGEMLHLFNRGIK